MKAALVIMSLFSGDPTVVVSFPTPEACMNAMMVQILKKPPGAQTVITCGPLVEPKIEGEESVEPPAVEAGKPKGEHIE